jgi:hypothetical protein
MKKLILILALPVLMFSCTIKGSYTDTPTVFRISSVDYHHISGDNTLQTTPYWKLHLMNAYDTITITSLRSYDVGDSIKVTIRKFHKDGK